MVSDVYIIEKNTIKKFRGNIFFKRDIYNRKTQIKNNCVDIYIREDNTIKKFAEIFLCDKRYIIESKTP